MMSGANSDLINTPDASRLIYGLRDTGYNFDTAAADIIDNSIAANAENVCVSLEILSDGRKFVYFGDDGDGMSERELFDAMRYGARERENLASLGKFGLGLKTASSSVCLKFSLISRKEKGQPLSKLSWDLEHVKNSDTWEMQKDDLTPEELEKFEELCGDRGTLLVWSKCDRLLSKHYPEPGGAQEKQAITRRANKLRDHVAKVYHRFLDPIDKRARNVNIFINGRNVEAWNPFFPEKSEQVLTDSQQWIECELEDGSSEKARIRAWILPHRDDCTEEEKNLAKHSNIGQGFYVFRENRLIHSGGWLGIHQWASLDPHLTLLRVEFDFNYLLDEAFMVDVKKSRILLDPALEDYVKKLLTPVRREADRRYRRKVASSASSKNVNHNAANKSIGSTSNTKKPAVVGVDDDGATISNTRGATIKLKLPVQNGVDPNQLFVEATDDITGGELWEPSLRSSDDSAYAVGVRINKNHDFYRKIYLRAKSNGYSVQGMDLLLWALSAAEQNYIDPSLQPIFEDLREDVSSNLRKLLREVDVPDLDSDEDE